MAGDGTARLGGIFQTNYYLHTRQIGFYSPRWLSVVWSFNSGKKGRGEKDLEIEWDSQSNVGWRLTANINRPAPPHGALNALRDAMPQSELDFLATLIAKWRLGVQIDPSKEYRNFLHKESL
jgi:hypothetical protein